MKLSTILLLGLLALFIWTLTNFNMGLPRPQLRSLEAARARELQLIESAIQRSDENIDFDDHGDN